MLELPTVWACASAEWFAWGAMSILRAAGAQAISFGSESGDNAALAALSLCLDSGRFQAELRRFLEQGLPFAACRQAAADALLGQDVAACLTRPNDNLAVEYLKAARRLNWTPQILAIPRVGAGHDGGAHPEFPSASFLREEILAGRLEAGNPAALKYNERGILTRLRAMDLPDFEALPDSGEGLARRLYQAARRAVTLEEVYAQTKTKRYAHARIRRLVLWAALGLRAADRPSSPSIPAGAGGQPAGACGTPGDGYRSACRHQARPRQRYSPGGTRGPVYRLLRPVPEAHLPLWMGVDTFSGHPLKRKGDWTNHLKHATISLPFGPT